MNFVREHPLLTGGLLIAIVVLFVVIKNRSRGGSQVISTGPSEGLQAAGLSAQVQQNQAQIAASLHLSDLNAAMAAHDRDAQLQLQIAGIQKDVALSSILTNAHVDMSRVDAATQIAQIQTKGQTDQTQAVVNGQIVTTGIQAGVQQHQFDVALAAQKDIDAASIQTTQIGADRDVTIANTAGQTAIQIANTNAGRDVSVATIAGTTATTLSAQEAQRQTDLARIVAPVVIHGIDTQAEVYNNLIGTQGQVEQNRINTMGLIDQQTLQLIRSGQLNKGGSGGLNQVSALSLIYGAPQVAATGAAVQNPDAPNPILAGIGKLIGGAGGFLSAIFG